MVARKVVQGVRAVGWYPPLQRGRRQDGVADPHRRAIHHPGTCGATPPGRGMGQQRRGGWEARADGDSEPPTGGVGPCCVFAVSRRGRAGGQRPPLQPFDARGVGATCGRPRDLRGMGGRMVSAPAEGQTAGWCGGPTSPRSPPPRHLRRHPFREGNWESPVGTSIIPKTRLSPTLSGRPPARRGRPPQAVSPRWQPPSRGCSSRAGWRQRRRCRAYKAGRTP